MAIQKTVFSSVNSTNSNTEIAEWLSANAEALGFTVKLEQGQVNCTNENGTNFLIFKKVPSSASVDISITLANGAYRNGFTSNGAVAWNSGYVCTNGLALYAKKDSNSGLPCHMWVFIGKTESGGLCVVCQCYTFGGYEKLGIAHADIEKGVAITQSYETTEIATFYPYTNGKATPRTSFAPICLDSGDIAQDMFFTPQTQRPMTGIKTGLETIIYDGKDEYVYSGIIAMKG